MEELSYIEYQLSGDEFCVSNNFSVDILNINCDIIHHVGVDNSRTVNWIIANDNLYNKPQKITYIDKHIISTSAVIENNVIGHVVAITNNVSKDNVFLWKALVEFYSKSFIDDYKFRYPVFLNGYNFTSREKEIIGFILAGKKDRIISDELFISQSTVRKHLHNIYDKFNVSNKLEFACKFYNLQF